ncbi:MAG: preprotein translocase subunit SecE [Oscillospiraceae bacterium]
MADKQVPAKKGKKSLFSRFGKYFRDVAGEFKKVVWPSKKQTWNNVVVVLVTVLIFGIIVWTLDFGLNFARDLIFNRKTEEVVAGAFLSGLLF